MSSCQLCSSSQVVLNNDDLLTLILLHVPRKKLISLKCVSRQWLSLITNPHFIIRLRSLPPFRISGLFFQQPVYGAECNKVDFVHLNDLKTPSPFSFLTFAHDHTDPERVCIKQSCNALLLCCTDRSANITLVYNPSTNQLDTLPKHPCTDSYGLLHIDLIFDPSKSLHYKVISFLTRPQPSVGDFYIYSSETKTWRPSIKSYLPSPDMLFRDGAYWNGCLHWLSEYSNSRPVSDSLYFNVDEERLQTFPSPPISEWSVDKSYFGESEDHLHYTEVCPFDSSFRVYEMKSDYSEWFVKYQIDLVPISITFPEMKDCFFYTCDSFNAAVVSLIRRENFKEDSFLVLEIPGKIIRYNLVDKSFKVIWEFVLPEYGPRFWPCGGLKAWPIIE
ncbi:F-box family protein [Heracleum sosnowskyi]|uniref:F-box family protein n=1 Tax=Heracleum sosnowskyi TaxID=360622 RepID=A0AAD8HBC7_9APIA|nr:F-box family protein [Heracleum sosnowskyi]